MSRPPVSICTPYLLTPDPAEHVVAGHDHTCSVVGLHKPEGSEYIPMPNLPVDEGRNACVDASKHDYLFFMDCDQTFHPNTLARLLARGKDIITGIYFARNGYPIPHIYKWYRVREGDDATLYKPCAQLVLEHLDANHAELYGKPPSWVLEEMKDEHVIEIDGCGLGCILIKREVFEKIGFPYFERHSDRGGEDFDFCRKAQEKGYKIYADLSVLCGHYGWEQRGWQHFLAYTVPEPYPWVSRDKHSHDVAELFLGEGLIGHMAEWLQTTPDDVIQRIMDNPQEKVAEAWKKANPQTQEERDLFYATCPDYLYDLVMWNVSPTFRNIIDSIPPVEGKTILDFGAGLGSTTLWMAGSKAKQVDYCDLPGVLWDFAAWRCEKSNLSYCVNFISNPAFKNKYDMVVAIDVFEHLPEETLAYYLNQLYDALRPGGQIFCHVEYDKHGGAYPQHYEYRQEYMDMMRGAGFEQVQMSGSIQLWRKPR